MNSEQFELGNLRQAKNPKTQFVQLFQLPILASNRTVLLLCSPPPLHPKRDLTNPIDNSLFTRNPNLEEQISDQLRNA